MDNKHEIQSIKFYAMIPKQGGEPETKGTFFSVGKAEGSKSPIRRLSVSYGASYIIVHQITEDGEAKSFLYKLSDIVGRVEVTEVAL